MLTNAGDAAEQDFAFLADLLSVPAGISVPDSWTLHEAQDQTFRTVLRHIESLAANLPLLVIVEDFHWADPTTRALLDVLMKRIEEVSALLVVSTRPERGPQWSLYPQVTTQLLNGLDRKRAALLVRQIAGEQPLADDVVLRIVERAQGVPLFIEELTRGVLTNTLDSDGERLLRVLWSSGEAIPTSLNALLMARLDQLDAGQEVAQASSVIGREFSFDMLRSVAGSSPERLRQGLAELAKAGLIVPHGPPGNATYVFYHTLIQEAAYASMLRDRRRTIHLRYAEALEQDDAGAASTSPELVAAHFAEAGAAEKSIDYYLKAAARATGRFALTEIVGYLRKGLRQLSQLPVTRATQKRELALQVATGRALMEHRGAGDPDVRATLDRAHQLGVALDGTDELLHIYDGLANYYFAHSELDKVVEHGQHALELGRRTDNHHAVVLAYRSSGHARLLLGNFREARDDLVQAVTLYRGTMAITRDPKVSACSALGICLTALGLTASGAAMSLAGIRHAEEIGHPNSLDLGLRRGCVEGMMRRDARRVLELSKRLLDNQTEYETFRGSHEGLFFSTWARLQTDRDSALYDRLYATLDHFENDQHLNMLTFFMLSAAELMEMHGDQERAAQLLNRATQLVATTNERWCESEIPRMHARLTTNTTAAIHLLETSLALAREQGALIWEVRAAMDLARLLREQGQLIDARRALAPVFTRITEGTSSPDFVTARVLLEELNAATAI